MFAKPKIVDLTQNIYVGMPSYDITVPTQIFPLVTYDQIRDQSGGKHVALMFGLLLCDHAGTHVDSISHVSDKPDALAIDQFPLDLFYTDAICLDVSEIRLPNYITRKVLQDALKGTGLELSKGDTLLLYTGHYDRLYPSRDYMSNHSGLDRDAMNWIADQGAVNVGVDAPSIEHMEQMASWDFPAHKVCVERGLINTENLCNLNEVAGKRFTFIGFPLPFQGASGSPIRAVAVLNEEELSS
jgi:kynurenine formamidase